MAGVAYVNGRFVAESRAVVSAFDRGLMYGDGLFETVRAYAGVPFMLRRHLQRLWASARLLKIKPPIRQAELIGVVDTLLRRNRLSDARIRITLTRGPQGSGLGLRQPGPATLIVQASKVVPYPDALYRKGARVIVSRHRQNADSPVVALKSANYLLNILAKDEAHRAGADEAILLNTRGEVAEGAVSNVFIVKRGSVVTPSLDSGILPGVTRGIVLDICRGRGIDAVEKRISPRALETADEIFLTNSLMEIMPVSRLGRRPLPIGIVTRTLADVYRLRVSRGTR